MRRTVTLAQFQGILRRFPESAEGAIVRGLRSAAVRGKAEVVRQIDNAKPHPAVDSGGLRQSVTYERLEKGGELFVDAPHAPHLNFGTRPFWPPKAPLILWMVRKGLVEDEDEAEELVYVIQRKIASEGIAPRHFFSKAMGVIVHKYVPAEIRQEMRSMEP